MLLLSAAATLIALVIAGFAIAHVLERFVIRGIDDRLETSIALMASTVRPDGSIDRARAAALQPAFASGPGWQWRIDSPADHLGSIGEAQLQERRHPRALPEAPPLDRFDPRPESDRTSTPFDGRLGDGSPFHGRRRIIQTSAGPVTLLASAPRRLVDRPIGAAIVPLLATLGILGALLAAAAVIQLRLGLRPLTRLRTAIGQVRDGTAARVPEDQPNELRPLAQELNALIGQNAAALANARGHVANLAHGLKTPLATLSLGLGEPGSDPSGALSAEVAKMDRAIRHHLGRARTDAAGATAQVSTPITPALAGLAEALSRIHADRGIRLSSEVADDLAALIDPQDLDELLGNLLDNACRWAASRIAVTAAAEGRMLTIHIEDDGPGIPPDRRATALGAGQRLDERGDGHGFGLAIARELAELHGGSLVLDASILGGLAVRVSLPLAAPRQAG
jgi:signal transduction histidine kinase